MVMEKWCGVQEPRPTALCLALDQSPIRQHHLQDLLLSPAESLDTKNIGTALGTARHAQHSEEDLITGATWTFTLKVISRQQAGSHQANDERHGRPSFPYFRDTHYRDLCIPRRRSDMFSRATPIASGSGTTHPPSSKPLDRDPPTLAFALR